MTRAEAVEQLVARVPELRPAFDEHVRDYDELLAHVFFGDVSRFVVTAEVSGSDELVERTLGALEALLKEEDAEIRELVGAFFVENIAWDADDASERVRRELPPLWAAELRRQRKRRP